MAGARGCRRSRATRALSLAFISVIRVGLLDPAGRTHEIDDGDVRDVGPVGDATPERARGVVLVQSRAELVEEPRLAEPRLSGDEDDLSAGPRVPRRTRSQQQLQLCLAPDVAGRGRARRRRRRANAGPVARRARKTCSGCALFFTSWEPRSSKTKYPSASRWVASLATTVPGSARPWTREAVFTVSPTAWNVNSRSVPMRPNTTSPEWIPTRTRRSMSALGELLAAAASSPSWSAEPGEDRALCVVLMRDRGAEQREQPVTLQLRDRALVAMDRLEHRVERPAHQSAQFLGVQPLRQRRVPDDVGKQHGDELALPLHVGRTGPELLRELRGHERLARGECRLGARTAERGAAVRAEPPVRRVHATARATDLGERSPARPAEPGVGRVGRPTCHAGRDDVHGGRCYPWPLAPVDWRATRRSRSGLDVPQ